MDNRQICLDGVDRVENLDFEPLHKNFLKSHLVGVGLAYLVLMGLALLLLLADSFVPCIIAEAALLLLGIANLMIVPAAYRCRGFALREHDISYRKGIIFPMVITIPYGKIQQVSVSQNPVSRLFGLFSVTVTNGAQSLDSLIIPGLTRVRADEVKSFLISKMRDGGD